MSEPRMEDIQLAQDLVHLVYADLRRVLESGDPLARASAGALVERSVVKVVEYREALEKE